jgi:hypothetical protein
VGRGFFWRVCSDWFGGDILGMFWVGQVPKSQTVSVFSGYALSLTGKESLLAFNEYEGVPCMVDEFKGYGFVVFSEVAWDVVSCVLAYCTPLGNTFDVSR